MISEKAIIAGTGCKPEAAKKWVQPIHDACERYGITSKNAIAAFLANIGVESASLTDFTENLNYSAAGLAATWPSRYKDKVTGGPNALAQRLARKPQEIANNTYANRMGNGDEASGDGWRYSGKGAIQLTGKDNYEAYTKASGFDAVNDPESLANDPFMIIDSAAWFFAERANCIPAANAGNFDQVVKNINGQPPVASNHGPLRKARYQNCLKAL